MNSRADDAWILRLALIVVLSLAIGVVIGAVPDDVPAASQAQHGDKR